MAADIPPPRGPQREPLIKKTYKDQDHLDVMGHMRASKSAKNRNAVEGLGYWNQQMQAELQDQLAKSPIVKQAKNIIFFLGDGTSISTLTAARLLKGHLTGNDEHEVMAYEKFPYSSLIKTYSADKIVTDSAASATAYLTGAKGNQATIGVDANVLLSDCDAMNNPSYHTPSVLKNFQKFTPKGVDDPEGGDGGKRDDGKNLIQTWIDQKQVLGNASYVWHREDLLALDTANTDYLMGLFDWSHMSFAIDEDTSNPSLEEMTRAAIEVLQRDDNGFFLFVEGGNIDKAHHLNEHRSALQEALEFEKAIALADSMTDPEETLIIVTADHSQPLVINGYPERGTDVRDLGDFSDVDGLPFTTLMYTNGPGYRGEPHGERPDPSAENYYDPHYMGAATVPMIESHHAGEEVILYARGPHAHLFTGIHENAYIPTPSAPSARVGPPLSYLITPPPLGTQAPSPSLPLAPDDTPWHSWLYC
ncbi:alkaline phosphate [Penaeus vannamei]|uniref:Alkaline phosphatase n=1 Tax=Penaeus vannamei TaxID=6689 RepID=A0A3R7ME78_PENVA|nr:alkaline phosphate [Penaeus vannamei]